MHNHVIHPEKQYNLSCSQAQIQVGNHAVVLEVGEKVKVWDINFDLSGSSKKKSPELLLVNM